MLFFIPKPIRRVIYLAVLLGLLSVADVGVRLWAERQVETLAREQFQGAASVDVSFSGFPFVGRLLLLGEIDAMDVTLKDVAGQRLTYGRAGVRLTGIEVDRGHFLSDREVRLLDLSTGAAFAELTEAEVSRIVGQPIGLRPGTADVVVGGQAIQAAVTVENGAVVMRPLGAPAVAVPLHAFEFLPCATNVTVLSGRLRVSCTIHTIPAPLVRATSGAANQTS